MQQLSEHFGWIEILFVAVVTLGFGFYQLWSVNREIAKDRKREERDSDAAGHAIGEHELDDRRRKTIEIEAFLDRDCRPAEQAGR